MVDHELGRRIALAGADFKTLQLVLADADSSQVRKLRIYNTCIISRLVYGLHTVCMNKSSRRRLDGFQTRCLRKTLGVLPSLVSRVSNAQVRLRPEWQHRGKCDTVAEAAAVDGTSCAGGVTNLTQHCVPTRKLPTAESSLPTCRPPSFELVHRSLQTCLSCRQRHRKLD